MDTSDKVAYSTNDLIKMMLRVNDIHDGNWILGVDFGFMAMNIRTNDADTEVNPSGIVSIQKIGLQRVLEPTPFSVDAAKSNPSAKKKSSPKKP